MRVGVEASRKGSNKALGGKNGFPRIFAGRHEEEVGVDQREWMVWPGTRRAGIPEDLLRGLRSASDTDTRGKFSDPTKKGSTCMVTVQSSSNHSAEMAAAILTTL